MDVMKDFMKSGGFIIDLTKFKNCRRETAEDQRRKPSEVKPVRLNHGRCIREVNHG